jgi:rieske iron-sulfur protein
MKERGSARPGTRASAPRRLVVFGLAGTAVGFGEVLRAPVLAQGAQEQRPTLGDRLVPIDRAGAPQPLEASEIGVNGKPVIALPYDPANGIVRDGSKLNRILLIRVPPDSVDSDPSLRSTLGVMAFSALCTHEGCAVTEWIQAEKRLLCPCHFSKFDALGNGTVVEGPAPRALPRLPLRVENQELVVDGDFTSAPGVRRS